MIGKHSCLGVFVRALSSNMAALMRVNRFASDGRGGGVDFCLSTLNSPKDQLQ